MFVIQCVIYALCVGVCCGLTYPVGARVARSSGDMCGSDLLDG